MGKAPFVCQFCGREFQMKWKMNRHIADSHGTKVYCEYCQKPFKTKNGLRRHQRAHCVKAKQAAEAAAGGQPPQQQLPPPGQVAPAGVRKHADVSTSSPAYGRTSHSQMPKEKRRRVLEEEIDALFEDEELDLIGGDDTQVCGDLFT